jgi:very-short-patch-repair endonuclease
MISKEDEYKLCEKIEENYTCGIVKEEDVPYVLYLANDVGKLIGIMNVKTTIKHFTQLERQNRVRLTKGGPQLVIYLTHSGLMKLLSRSRKPQAIDFCKRVEIHVNNFISPSIEVETINIIMKCFESHLMITQYVVKNYKLDLYFPTFKLAIECDEAFHNTKANTERDKQREEEIKENTDDIIFIRYSPYENDFNIYNLINKIHLHILNHNTHK